MIIVDSANRWIALGAKPTREGILCAAMVAVDDLKPGRYTARCYPDGFDTPFDFVAILDEELMGEQVYGGTILGLEDDA